MSVPLPHCRLREVRKARGLTLRDLEALTGTSKATISRWERCVTDASLVGALRLAWALGVRVEELFSLAPFDDD